MEYQIIGTYKKEYKNDKFPTKYYVHTVCYPHVIQVAKHIYEEVVKNKIDSLNFPVLDITQYDGQFYYKYGIKEE